MRLFINGVVRGRAALRYSTFDALARCGIGANAPLPTSPPTLGLRASRSFVGQLASVHVVDDCLTSEDVAFVYGLGAQHAGAWGDVGGSERCRRLLFAYHRFKGEKTGGYILFLNKHFNYRFEIFASIY